MSIDFGDLPEVDLARVKLRFFEHWPRFVLVDIRQYAPIFPRICPVSSEDLIALWLCGFVSGFVDYGEYPASVVEAWEVACQGLPVLTRLENPN